MPPALGVWNRRYDDPPFPYEPLMPELNHLKEPEIQKIPHLSVQECQLSYRFNLLDLCHERQTLELWLKESWEDCHPMISQFLQNVYNGVDIGPLERVTVATIRPPSWRPDEPDMEELSRGLPGNVPFTILKPSSCQVEHAENYWSVIHYCETATKRLLLSARDKPEYRIDYIRFDLYIIPLDDYSTFIQHLADGVYRPPKYGLFEVPGTFPIDNSYLHSLLEDANPSQYALILKDYIANLNSHMNMDEYYEREGRGEQEDLGKDGASSKSSRISDYVSWKLNLSR